MAIDETHGEDVAVDAEHVRLGEPAGSLGREERLECVEAPLGVELVVGPRRAERAGAPARERVYDLVELGPVLRQLVDGRGCRRGELALLHYAGRLELAQ